MTDEFTLKLTSSFQPESEMDNGIVFPNPATDKIYIELEDKTTYVYYATIFDNVGRTKYMLPKPDAQDGINISTLKPGYYFITIRDSKGKSTTKKFIKL